MHRFDTVFFDWGGVIADDPGDEFLGLLLKNIGANDAQVEEIFESYMVRFMCGDITEKEYWNHLHKEYGLDIHDTISDEFKKWKGLITNERVFDLVNTVQSKGIKAALLTNVIEPTYNVLDGAGYYDRFDAVIASCKVGLAKPQDDIYTLALDTLQTTAEKSIFIDDKQKNIVPAQRLGFTTILAENPDQIINDLQRYL